MTTGEIVGLVRKEGNGWWLVKRLDGDAQGWAPSAYLEEIAAAVAPKKVAPPPPKRPKPKAAVPAAATPDRGSSGASTSGDSFAGGLAEALKQRQAAMSAKKDDDDDDW